MRHCERRFPICLDRFSLSAHGEETIGKTVQSRCGAAAVIGQVGEHDKPLRNDAGRLFATAEQTSRLLYEP